jgi:hypothetical protein
MSRFGSFFALSPARRRLFAGALALTILARGGFIATSFQRTTSLFGRVPVVDRSDVSRSDIRWAARTASEQVPGVTCLARAVVAHTLCRRHSHPSIVYVGVERGSEEFLAHSWVESRGDIVVGDNVDLDEYETLGVVES